MKDNGKQGNKMERVNLNGLANKGKKDKPNVSMLANIKMGEKKVSASIEIKNQVLYSKGFGIMET